MSGPSGNNHWSEQGGNRSGLQPKLLRLKEIAEALNEAKDVSEAMSAILPQLSAALGLTTAWAFRYDDVHQAFVEVGASGLPTALACDDQSALKTGWCECQDQFMSGRLDSAVNIVRCSRLRDAVGDKRNLKYHASIPLKTGGKSLGILNVAAEGHQVFTNEALAFLGAVGHHVAVAVDRAGILADERRHASQLAAMSTFAHELFGMASVQGILRHAAEQFVDRLGYETCGILLGRVPEAQGEDLYPGKLVAAAHRRHEVPSAYGYSYETDDDNGTASPQPGVILPIAHSVMEQAIPRTEYIMRIESSTPRAFRKGDEDLLRAFVWFVSSAVENVRAREDTLVNAKWLERRQIAAQLHDAVSQRLFSAVLLTNSLKLKWQQAENRDRDGDSENALNQIGQLIQDSQREMRELIETLRPARERGWTQRIREHVLLFQLQSGTRFHLTIETDDNPLLDFEAEDTILKVLDEASQNVLKHANARSAYVNLWDEEGAVYLTVQDDGIGFDVGSRGRGLGTTTMRDRAFRAGGSLSIDSTPGQGTTVTCKLPALRHGKCQ